MKLFEYEGKQLLTKYGIPIPNGFLWEKDSIPRDRKLLAKVQVLTGGRGKAGGIVPVKKDQSLEEVVKHLFNQKIKDETPQTIYFEEMVSFQHEFYLSIVMNRNRQLPTMVLSKHGGIEVEAETEDQIHTIPIHPFIGLQPYMIRQAGEIFEVPDHVIRPVLTNIWRLFQEEEAELVEINPLFYTTDGKFCAGDAKIILSRNEPASLPVFLPRKERSFETQCKELGVVGVELDGDTVIVTSGAGLGMATFDWFYHHQRSIRASIDLGGHVIHDRQAAQQLMDVIIDLQPKSIFFNVYFQVASCLILAQAIANKFGKKAIPITVRLHGKDAKVATHMLAPYSHITVTHELEEALIDLTNRTKGDH